MITLNTKGHKERKALIKSGETPQDAHKQALSKPENHYRKSKK